MSKDDFWNIGQDDENEDGKITYEDVDESDQFFDDMEEYFSPRKKSDDEWDDDSDDDLDAEDSDDEFDDDLDEDSDDDWI